jgi:hypothetical protein
VGVTTRAACDVENDCVSRQRGHSVDDPLRRRTVRLRAAAAVPRLPFGAVPARIESSAH